MITFPKQTQLQHLRFANIIPILCRNCHTNTITKVNYNTMKAIQIYKLQNMSKFVLLWAALCLMETLGSKSLPCKLKIINDPNNPDNVNTEIQIYPAVYSSPVENLNHQIFVIYKATPLDGCASIKEPDIESTAKIDQYPTLVVIDGDTGICGLKRRINMAKQIGAKGLIILSSYLDDAIQPYGDYSDNKFLVFIADSAKTKSTLLAKTYFLGAISSPTDQNNNKPELQFWLSTLDDRSYEIISFWDQTTKDIPAIADSVNWRPRYALWGCKSKLFSPGSGCQNTQQYMSSCACGGELCSPETRFKAADATVKEDARQKIMFMDHRKQFIPYMLGFMRNCLANFQIQLYSQDCGNNLIQNLGITISDVEKKLDTFVDKCSGDIYESLIIDRNRFSQLGTFPTVILDRQPIQFTNLKEFQTQLCKKLSLDQEEGCVKISKVNTIANFTVSALFFVLVIGGLIVIVAVLLLVYRKSIRKEMQKEMKMQVSASVEHYFALAETK